MSLKSILVTGGCGYIGSHVCRQLSEAGNKVIVVDNLTSGFADALLHGEKLYVGDFGSSEVLTQIFSENKIDVVMHFAASIVVPESVENPLKYYRNNTANFVTLLESCIKHNISKFVLSSTAAVYGENDRPMVKEDDPVAPTNPYAASKSMDERILRDVSFAHPLNYVVLRYFNVAGADLKTRIGQRTPNATHLIKVACETLVGKRKGMEVFGTDYPTRDGTCIRDYIHVEDLADAHLKAVAYLSDGGKSVLLNCGYGNGFSVLEVLKGLEKVAGKPVSTKMSPRRPGDIAQIVAGVDKIKSTLGWTPQYNSLPTILKSALDWEKKLSEQK